MKKFQFSLSSMLNYKDALLNKEKNMLLQLRARQIAIEEKIERSEKQLLVLETEMKTKAMRGMTMRELKTFEFHLQNARGLLKQLGIELARARDDVEEQRRLVVGLSQEVSGLEKLGEKQREEYNYGLQKEEELRIGELVSLKYAVGNSSFEHN